MRDSCFDSAADFTVTLCQVGVGRGRLERGRVCCPPLRFARLYRNLTGADPDALLRRSSSVNGDIWRHYLR